MNDRKKYYMLGVFAASILVVSAMNLPMLEAVSKNLSVSRLPAELRMGIEIGILDVAEVKAGLLDVPIRKREFGILLKKILQLLGAPAGSELSDLNDNGILDNYNLKKSIARKAVLEAICRALIHLTDNQFIVLDGQNMDGFTDYYPPEKYRSALSFLRRKDITRGYPDGSFGISKAVTKRETIYLLYRLYEQVSSTMIKKQSDKGVCFVDIPMDHPIMESLKVLEREGAFQNITLRKSFDGFSPITQKEVSGMIMGISARYHPEEKSNKIGSIIADVAPNSPTTRRHFAFLLENLLPLLQSNSEQTAKPIYKDVSADSPEYSVLEALAQRGILIGYPDGTLRGNECVSWFETVGVLHSIVSKLSPYRNEISNDAVAGKSDFETYAAILKAKKMRIHNIMMKNPVPQKRNKIVKQ